MNNDCANQRIENGFPALFTAPYKYWKGIVRNGTRAIVFHLGFNELLTVLNDLKEEDHHLKDYATLQIKELEELLREGKICDNSMYYIKFRTRDTSYHFETNNFVLLYSQMKKYSRFEEKPSSIKDPNTPSFCEEFFKTYIVEPFQDKVSMVVIMADRGSTLHENELSDFTTLKKLLKPLKETVDLLAKKMCHGDLLPHNFVIDREANTLHIIDLDEGGIADVPRREMPANTDEDSKWFFALRYPNPLRDGNRELYTKVQFAAAFLMLTKNLELDELEKLLVVATDLGNELVQADTSETRAWHKGNIPESILGHINLIDKKVNEFLGIQNEYCWE